MGDAGRIRATTLERATQTNEVGMWATLWPAFASVLGDGPLGLLEIGASADLCLYPYRWSKRRLAREKRARRWPRRRPT